MSRTTHSKRAGQAGIVIAAALALGVSAPAAHAAAVDLGVAQPFVVLGGQSVTNTGPSVLNGDLGVSPGTSLVGFGFPAVVNGATHANDAVAANAQAAGLNAYDVAAGEPVSPGNVLTGQNLGNRTLTPGAYRFASSAQLTGELTLDAQGDPNAQFIFQIGSTLTTASASSVRLLGGASPCNVFWQVGSSATIGSTTLMQGNVLAKASASLDAKATVRGRVLAQTGSVTLIDNTLDASMCRPAGTTPPLGGSGGSGGPSGDGATGGTTGGPGTTGTATGGGPAATAPGPSAGATAFPAAVPTGRVTLRRTPRDSCRDGFRASVRGSQIKRVEFRLDGRRIGAAGKAAAATRQVDVQATPGAHTITARVTFRNGARSRVLKFDYKACASAVRRVRRGPAPFTG